MFCKQCDHFKIQCEPQIIGGQCWDFGQAICQKHNLITDFKTHNKLEKLKCIEDKE